MAKYMKDVKVSIGEKNDKLKPAHIFVTTPNYIKK